MCKQMLSQHWENHKHQSLCASLMSSQTLKERDPNWEGCPKRLGVWDYWVIRCNTVPFHSIQPSSVRWFGQNQFPVLCPPLIWPTLKCGLRNVSKKWIFENPYSEVYFMTIQGLIIINHCCRLIAIYFLSYWHLTLIFLLNFLLLSVDVTTHANWKRWDLASACLCCAATHHLVSHFREQLTSSMRKRPGTDSARSEECGSQLEDTQDRGGGEPPRDVDKVCQSWYSSWGSTI